MAHGFETILPSEQARPATPRASLPMPIVQADRLTRIGSALLKAAGASEEEADAVAVGCVNANLAGHDSHGVIAIPTYIDRITAGHIRAMSALPGYFRLRLVSPRSASPCSKACVSVGVGSGSHPPWSSLLELSEDGMVRRMPDPLNYGSFREWCRHRLGLGSDKGRCL